MRNLSADNKPIDKNAIKSSENGLILADIGEKNNVFGCIVNYYSFFYLLILRYEIRSYRSPCITRFGQSQH